MIEIFSSPESWISLLTLVALEIVLGFDNIIFITILSSKLPHEERSRARRMGLGVAVVSRLCLLLGLAAVIRMTQPMFTAFSHSFSLRDLILVLGGLFLIMKATVEIYKKVELHEEHEHALRSSSPASRKTSLASVLVQILFIDVIFSLDSVITAAGTVQHIEIMISAVIVSVAIMIFFADAVGDFVEKRPSMKILALAFLVMIGVLLLGEGFGEHFNKSYGYFGMAFAFAIEMLNLRRQVKSAKHVSRSGSHQSVVLYEVRADYPKAWGAPFDSWFENHVKEVFATGHFESASWFISTENPHDWKISYLARSRDDVNAYLKSEAPRLRGDIEQAFGPGFNAQRKIWTHRLTLEAPEPIDPGKPSV